MPLITTTHGKSFAIEAGESILDAALKQGIQLAYSCRTGRCSTCKSKVVEGQSVALKPELGLTDQEKAQGWVLTCVRSAVTDVTVDVQDLGGVTLPTPRTFPCRIQSLQRLAPDVLQVTLRLPPTSELAFLPGQYVDVIGPAGVRRSYSLANRAGADKLLTLHIREVADGAMSQYWFQQAAPNDLLRLHGPLGTFFLRDIAGRHLVFLATGTGIAPVKAMLEELGALAPQDRPAQVSIYWGGRLPGDLYWRPDALTITHRFVPVLSRADGTWTGARGHVQHALMKDGFDPANTVVYACGSDAMIHSARQASTQAGLPEKCFLSDAFVCSATN